MIIDFHTHTFPDNMASKVINKLSLDANIKNYNDGTLSDLKKSMSNSNVDYSVMLSVATKPGQTESINTAAIKLNETSRESHIIPFGAIHPENDNYKEIINSLYASGIKGIKIHPVFCNVPIDNIRFKRIISYASEKNMIVITHAGLDVGFPGNECVAVPKIYNMIKDVEPTKMVLAHMGGWAQWQMVRDMLCGENVWIDTSFSITPLRESQYWDRPIKKSDGTIIMPDKSKKIVHSLENEQLSNDLFLDIIRSHGVHRFLFGTDNPWGDQNENITYLHNSGLSESELELILGENARKLLEI